MGAQHLVVPSLGILAGVPELHVHPLLLRLRGNTSTIRDRPNSYDSCGWKLCEEVMTTPSSIKKFPKSEVLSSWTRKVFFDAIRGSESAERKSDLQI